MKNISKTTLMSIIVAISLNANANNCSKSLKHLISKRVYESRDYKKTLETNSFLNKDYVEMTAVPGEISRIKSFEEASITDVLATSKLKESEGGGELNLVKLDINDRAYNHVEGILLLRNHPELANRLGFYKDPINEGAYWAPDATTLNFRMKKFLESQGVTEQVLIFDPQYKTRELPGNEVAGMQQYLDLVAQGYFPFASKNFKLSIHDGMHSFGFMMLNTSSGGRQILKTFQKRAEIIKNLQVLVLENSNLSEATSIVESMVNDNSLWGLALEQTMKASILTSGNMDYFKPTENYIREDSRGHDVATREQFVSQAESHFSGGIKDFNFKEKMLEKIGMIQNETVRSTVEEAFLKDMDSIYVEATAADIKSAAEHSVNFIYSGAISN